MNELIEKLKAHLEPIVNQQGLILDQLNYVYKSKEYRLEVFVEKDQFDVVSLEEIVALSELISEELDRLDMIEDNYTLDVSTSGVEKRIKDLSTLHRYINKYLLIKLKEPQNELKEIQGDLIQVDDNKVTMSYRQKTRTKTIEIQISNIAQANLAIKF